MADGSISPHAGINFDPRAEFQWFAMSTRAGACKAATNCANDIRASPSRTSFRMVHTLYFKRTKGSP